MRCFFLFLITHLNNMKIKDKKDSRRILEEAFSDFMSSLHCLRVPCFTIAPSLYLHFLCWSFAFASKLLFYYISNLTVFSPDLNTLKFHNIMYVSNPTYKFLYNFCKIMYTDLWNSCIFMFWILTNFEDLRYDALLERGQERWLHWIKGKPESTPTNKFVFISF